MRKGIGAYGRRKINKARLFVLAVLAFSVLILVFIEMKIMPIVEVIAEQRAHLAVVRVINEAAINQLGGGLAYDDLVTVHTNEKGEVTFIQPDSIRISRLATGVAKDIEIGLSTLATEGLLVPAGLISGITILSNVGPKIKLVLQTIGGVEVHVNDEFVSVGVNQSKHRISLEVKITVGLMLPFTRNIMDVETNLPLVESIIVGPIPQTYFNLQIQEP